MKTVNRILTSILIAIVFLVGCASKLENSSTPSLSAPSTTTPPSQVANLENNIEEYALKLAQYLRTPLDKNSILDNGNFYEFIHVATMDYLAQNNVTLKEYGNFGFVLLPIEDLLYVAKAFFGLSLKTEYFSSSDDYIAAENAVAFANYGPPMFHTQLVASSKNSGRYTFDISIEDVDNSSIDDETVMRYTFLEKDGKYGLIYELLEIQNT